MDKDLIQKLVNEQFTAQEPGCGVLIIQGGKTLMVTQGLAVMEEGEAVSTKTNFRLASVTKQFTATGILMLVEQGRLSLEQTLPEFFPGFPAYGAGITVEHLVRHTSGLKDYETLETTYDGVRPVMDAQVLAMLLAETEGLFAPGSKFKYSNSGYAVLAMIIETVSGVSYPDFLRQNIFEPLAMENTDALVHRPGARPVLNRAYGYALDAQTGWQRKDQSTTSAVLGDGGIYTSLESYEKWVRAYIAGKVLKPETVKAAWTPATTTEGETIPYGYGWRLEPLAEGQAWRPYHPGSTTGFRNGVVLLPEKQQVVLVLTNRCSGDSIALAKSIEAVI